jgi:hypothetical protein
MATTAATAVQQEDNQQQAPARSLFGMLASAVDSATQLLAPPLPASAAAPFSEDTLRLIVYQLWHGNAR